MGLKLVHEEDITDNVLKAMELDRERRVALVNKYVPAIYGNSSITLRG